MKRKMMLTTTAATLIALPSLLAAASPKPRRARGPKSAHPARLPMTPTPHRSPTDLPKWTR